jgi:hypothetical protein
MDEVGEIWFVMPETADARHLGLYDVDFFKTKLDAERYARAIYADRKDIDPYQMVYYRKVYSMEGECK